VRSHPIRALHHPIHFLRLCRDIAGEMNLVDIEQLRVAAEDFESKDIFTLGLG
jgi:hypothetical protein